MLHLRHLDRALSHEEQLERARWRTANEPGSRVAPLAPPLLRYTAADSTAANETWGANCGPHSIAAALGLSLEQLCRASPE
jgi:hypothetical protein